MIGTADKTTIDKTSGFNDWALQYKQNYREGTLDVHGAPRARVWTFLGATTLAGSSAFVTSEPCDFAPGEVVVLTSTSTNMYEAEEVVIAAVVSPTQYTTKTPFLYSHTAQVLSGAAYNFGRDVTISGQVGLLSRNVVVQGSSTSSSDLYGYVDFSKVVVGRV